MLKKLILSLIVISSFNMQAREITCECKNGEILFSEAPHSKVLATCHMGCSKKGGLKEIYFGYVK